MRYYSNTAGATTLENSGGVTPTVTQLILGNTTGYPTQFPFTLRLDPDTPVEEIVTVNSGAGTSGSPYVVSRGSDGTTARSHAQFSVVTHGFSARDLREPQDHMADTWIHTRRPLWSRQVSEPPFNVLVTWTNFTNAAWPAVTFTAPPSGIVKVTIGARLRNTQGSTIGVSIRATGGITITPNDDYNVVIDNGNQLDASRVGLITGITAGASTTITPAWIITGGDASTADITNGLLVVELQP